MFARAFLALFLTISALSAASPHVIGTWKLNVRKSTFSGMPLPKEGTVTYTAEGSGWRYDARTVEAGGKVTSLSFVFVKDKANIPLSGSEFGDTLVITNDNADVSHGFFKRGGKVVGQFKRTVEPGGKSMLVEGEITRADGSKVSYRSWYQKQ